MGRDVGRNTGRDTGRDAGREMGRVKREMGGWGRGEVVEKG